MAIGNRLLRGGVVGLASVTLWACSGAGERASGPSAPLVGTGSTVVGTRSSGAVVAVSPSPTMASNLPFVGASCPVQGAGTYEAQCTKGTGEFLGQVETAIAQVVAERPELFNLTRFIGEGGYYVNSEEAVSAEIVKRLQAMGLCAYWDFTRRLVQVKNSSSFSEDYEVIRENGHLRRGAALAGYVCTPASFPVSPADVIDTIRVGFYEIWCEDRTPPHNNEKEIPVDCVGTLTATPKTASGAPVDARIHGPSIEWTVIQNADYVELLDYEHEEFNKYLRAYDPGEFRVCATVQGVQGCMDGRVIK
jgi:hypothetical protein